MREIDDGDVLPLELGFIRLDIGIDGAKARRAPQFLRGRERTVVFRNKQSDMRPVRPHLCDLFARDVDVDVWIGEQDQGDLGVDPLVADGHLPQRFERHPISHRMGEDGDFLDLRLFDQIAQQRFQRIARIIGAFAVIAIGEDIALRGPGEQHRRDFAGAGIVQDLGEAVDRVFVALVEAMHKTSTRLSLYFRRRRGKVAMA